MFAALFFRFVTHVCRAKYSSLSDNPRVNEAAQQQLLLALGKIACAGSRCLRPDRKDSKQWQDLTCALCDESTTEIRPPEVYWDNHGYGEDWKEVIAALLAITKESKFQHSTRPRVLMAVAIGRLFNHISDVDYLNLEMCELGQWLLACMSRSLRELKIAATHALMVFLRNDISNRVRQKNRMSVVEFFDALVQRGILADQETLILAYGHIARVCGELELPIILHRLVEYLGHPNALICGMAYRELDALAEPNEPEVLFRPYWRILAFSVIKDITNKPQKAQQLADLTEQSVRQLLVLTQSFTLPHLVLTKRRDIIEKIAQARKVSVAEVLTQPRNNLAKILALLLSQSVPDIESFAMETLAGIEPQIREGSNDKLETLIAMDITGIAIEILVLSAEQDESRKAPVRICKSSDTVSCILTTAYSIVELLVYLPVSLIPRAVSANHRPKPKAWTSFARLIYSASLHISPTSWRAHLHRARLHRTLCLSVRDAYQPWETSSALHVTV